MPLIGSDRPGPDAERLPAALAALPGIEELKSAAAACDARLYLVGGAVRDILLGGRRADIDIAVEGDVAALARILGGVIRAHARFETATVTLGPISIDLARTRRETYPHPGALPRVEPAPLSDDLARRDFTVNAMAFPLGSAEPGDLRDPHGGLGDLAGRTLRILHPRSFLDDPTRTVRAARYAARLGLSPDPDTERRLRDAVPGAVSADRIEAELRKLAREPDPAACLRTLARWGVAEVADPELAGAVAEVCARPEWARLSSPAEAVLTAAGVSCGAFRSSPEPLERARELASVSETRPSRLAAQARPATGIELAIARALGAEWLDTFIGEWRATKLEISGQDLLDAGVPQGPALGRGLAAALDAKLDGLISGREEELAVALETARGNHS